ncbi:MAG TPA: flagellar basal body-associated FliL family protein [Burkholderiaceae bacterium]|nr:flagellar basal body-associated FliL family protein [Burkholderiaceae bacterium]
MSAAAVAASPAETGTGTPPKPRSKKKLVLFIAIALVALLLAGGATLVVMKMRAARAAILGDSGTATQVDDAHPARRDPDHPPVFLPLDPFVVNLADRDADRYAQIGLTFEVADAEFADRLKVYMPAIRNTVLMILAQKTSADLLDRPGKEQLATQIQREAARTMGIEVAGPSTQAVVADAGQGGKAPPNAVARKAAVAPNPIRHVLFSNFIIQ